MSKQVDERVVSMQFDNQHFEKNVSTTLGTLDKLKQSLNLTGASKGLENVNSAANKVNMSGLASGVETVRAKFSALEVMGVTALANITNSAVNAGKRIVHSLTIQPITTGFSEYELKMGSIQTIMASTGESLETVNKHLEELNKYSDDTIYSFSDMTQNIGKFTNAGVKLEDAVMAIKGISNEAAISGANANEASRAMYNFAQALSAGYVKLIDWKSIENANMATIGFKEQLIESAVAAGTLKKAADGMYETLDGTAISATKNFNESLQDQWMTTEVLVGTLKKYADKNTEIGAKATLAATEVKTFSQMLDTLKESAQSGWAQTWEIVFGDFYEGKALWTSISKVIGGIIDKMSTLRNTFLKKNLGSSFSEFEEQINKAGISTDNFKEKLKEVAKGDGISLDKLIEEYGSLEKAISSGEISSKLIIKTLKEMAKGQSESSKSTEDMTDKLEKFQKVVNEVWRGDYKNGEERIEALTKAGYKYAEVQALVNKTVDGHKLTLEDLSDAQLKNVGYTQEQITEIRNLAKQAEKAGTPLNELIEKISKPTGRELLSDTLSHLGEQIGKIIEAIKKGWRSIIPESDSSILYDTIEGIKELATSIKVDDKAAENFERIAAGVAALYDVTKRGISASFTTGIKLLSAVLGLFDMNLLDLAARMADYMVKFRNWLNEHDLAFNAIDKLAKIIKTIIDAIVECAKAFWGLESVQGFVTDVVGKIQGAFGWLDNTLSDLKFDSFLKDIEQVFTNIEGFIKGLDTNESFQAGLSIVQGIAGGIVDGAKGVYDTMKNLALSIIKIFKGEIDSNSPSKVFMAIGGFIVTGLILGIEDKAGFAYDTIKGMSKNLVDIVTKVIQNGIPFVMDLIGTAGKKILDGLKSWNVDFGSLLATGIVVTVVALVNKSLNIFDKFAKGVENLGGMFESLKGMFEAIGDGLKAKFKAQAWEARSKALINLALAIGILAATLYVLTNHVDHTKLWPSIGAIAALAAVIGLLAVAVGKWGPKQSLNFLGFSAAVLSLSASLLIMTFVMKQMEKVNADKAKTTFKGMLVLFGGVAAVMVALGVIARGQYSKSIKKAGGVLIKLAAALLIMAYVMEKIGELTPEEFDQGLGALKAFMLFVLTFAMITKLAGDKVKDAGICILAISGAILLLTYTIERIAELSEPELVHGFRVLSTFGIFIAGLMAVSRIAGKDLKGLGMTLIGMAAAMAIMVMVIKLIGDMDYVTLMTGIKAVGWLALIIAGLIWATRLAGDKELKRVGTTLLAMSAAIAIMAGIAVLLGMASTETLIKGVSAVGVLGVIVAGMIWATRGANDVKGSIIAMAVAIGVMAASIVVLSLIDPEKLIPATVALGLVMGMFARIMKASSNITTSLATLIVMTVAVGLLAGIIYLLTEFTDVNAAITAASAISVLLLSLSASMFIISKAGTVSPMALVTLGIMGLVVGELGVILGLLAKYDMAPSIETAVAISILMASLSAICLILAAVGPVAVQAIIGAAALAGVIAIVGGVVLAMAKIATSMLPDMGADLSAFMNNAKPFIEGLKSIDESTAVGAEALAKTIALLTASSLLDAITSWITGDNSMAEFAEQLVPFGEGIKNYSKAVEGVNIESIIASVKAAEQLVKLADIIPNSGGIASWFSGDNDISDFGTKLEPFGKGIKAYSNAVIGVDSEAISASVTSAKKIVGLIKSTSGLDASGVESFKTAMGTLGSTSVDNFVLAFESAYPRVSSAINNMINSATTSINSKQAVFQHAGGMLLIGFVNGINSKKLNVLTSIHDLLSSIMTTIGSYNAKFNLVGATLFNHFARGVLTKANLVQQTVRLMLSSIMLIFDAYYASFYSAGSYLVDGFAAGISANAWKAEAKARAMAKAAKQAAEDELGVCSPSKVFYKIGEFTGMGFVNALGDYAGKTYKAGKELASSARSGLNDAIGKVVDIINSDMNTQPTIRPVLDLSDIQNGVNGLNGLFGGQTLALAGATVGNVRAVKDLSAQLNGTVKTDNKDIINAITGLRGDVNALANAINNTQITMDSGAVVGTLIRKIDTNLGQIASYKGRGN